MNPETERASKIIDPATGMSPWEAAVEQGQGSVSPEELLLSAYEWAGVLIRNILNMDCSHHGRVTLQNWHARNRWRQCSEEMPPEGVRVRIRRNDKYAGEQHANRDGDCWCNDNWQGDVRIQPGDWWQPVTMPE